MLDNLRPIISRCRFAVSRQVCAALTLAWFGAAMAEEGPNRLPPPEIPLQSLPKAVAPATPSYLGPPAGIDGPEPVPSRSNPVPDPSGHAILSPETDGGEHLTFPGGLVVDGTPEDEMLLTPPQKLSAYKNSFFQKLSLSALWMGNDGDPADLGITEVETFLQVGLPAPIMEWPMLITPSFNMAMIKGATITDLPSRLYVASVDFMWLPQIVKGYTLLLSVVPSVF